MSQQQDCLSEHRSKFEMILINWPLQVLHTSTQISKLWRPEWLASRHSAPWLFLPLLEIKCLSARIVQNVPSISHKAPLWPYKFYRFHLRCNLCMRQSLCVCLCLNTMFLLFTVPAGKAWQRSPIEDPLTYDPASNLFLGGAKTSYLKSNWGCTFTFWLSRCIIWTRKQLQQL